MPESNSRHDLHPPNCSRMQVLTVMVGETRLGVEVGSVREIVRTCRVTPVPNSVRGVAGVFDWRGRVIPLIDLRARFGFHPACSGSERRIIIAEAIGRIAGLAVDAVCAIENIQTDGSTAQIRRHDSIGGLTDVRSAADGELILIDCSDLFGPSALAA